MKKITFIVILIAFNILLVYSKVNCKELIDLDLKENELAFVFIDNDKSKCVLVMNNDISIAYVLAYDDQYDLEKDIYKFTNNLNYVYMNDKYNLSLKGKDISNLSNMNNINLYSNKINYGKYNICFNNNDNCNFTYLLENKNINTNNLDAFIYTNNISNEIIENINNDWLDKYKTSKDNYLILIIGNDYEITNLIR